MITEVLTLLCKVWLFWWFRVAAASAQGALRSSIGWWSLWCSANVVAARHAWQYRDNVEHCTILGSPYSQPYAGIVNNCTSSNRGRVEVARWYFYKVQKKSCTSVPTYCLAICLFYALKSVYCITLCGNPSWSYRLSRVSHAM